MTGESDDKFEGPLGTPPRIWRPFSRAVGGFDLDPCSGAEPTPIADSRITKSEDGLDAYWSGEVWVHPPRGEESKWIRKSIAEVTAGRADRVLAFMPVVTNESWFHREVENISSVLFFQQKVQLIIDECRYPKSMSSPYMLAIIGKMDDELLSVCDEQGWVVKASDFRAKTTQTTLG